MRIDGIQQWLALKAGHDKQLLPLILTYRDLDEFIERNYEALDKHYSVGTKN